MKDLQKVNENSLGTYLESFEQVDDFNMNKWHGKMYGSPGSPYEDGLFHFTFEFDEYHPFRPPKVVFTTKIFHANIGLDGFICRDILMSHWAPAISADKIFGSIDSMMRDPNGAEFVNVEAGEMLNNDPKKYYETAKLWTKKYAC